MTKSFHNVFPPATGNETQNVLPRSQTVLRLLEMEITEILPACKSTLGKEIALSSEMPAS
jgi:hypothetical protein